MSKCRALLGESGRSLSEGSVETVRDQLYELVRAAKSSAPDLSRRLLTVRPSDFCRATSEKRSKSARPFLSLTARLRAIAQRDGLWLLT